MFELFMRITDLENVNATFSVVNSLPHRIDCHSNNLESLYQAYCMMQSVCKDVHYARMGEYITNEEHSVFIEFSIQEQI